MINLIHSISVEEYLPQESKEISHYLGVWQSAESVSKDFIKLADSFSQI